MSFIPPDELPATTPDAGVLSYIEGLLIGYRLFDQAERRPRFPFGHGLGYTRWDYRGAEAELSADGLVVNVAAQERRDQAWPRDGSRSMPRSRTASYRAR